MISLIDACADPELLGLDLWPAQREAAEALDAGARLVVNAWGRRGGKTTLAAAVALHDCLLRSELGDFVRPGERRYAVVVATSREQARVTIDAARAIVERSPLLAELIESDDNDEIRFSNGTALRALPCSARAIRGFPVSCLIFDEAAHFITETDGFQTAERVWAALTPSTAQFGDLGRIVVTSTPFGTTGLFADLFSSAEDLDGAVGLHFTTAHANPRIDPAFLDAERLRDPDMFRVEYLAEFTGSGDAYLDPERWSAADRGPLDPDDCEQWIAGLDPAFSRDPFGLVIVGRKGSRWRLGFAEALRPKRGAGAFDETIDAIVARLKSFGVRHVLTDQYSSAAIIDRLRHHGFLAELITMTAQSKTSAFAELRASLYSGELEVYAHDALITELSRLRTRFTAGAASVTNPRVGGSHGDIAHALALTATYIGRHRTPLRAYSYSGKPPIERDHEFMRGNLTLGGSERYLDKAPGGSRQLPPGWTRKRVI